MGSTRRIFVLDPLGVTIYSPYRSVFVNKTTLRWLVVFFLANGSVLVFGGALLKALAATLFIGLALLLWAIRRGSGGSPPGESGGSLTIASTGPEIKRGPDDRHWATR